MAFTEEAKERIKEKVLWQSRKYFLVFPWHFTWYKITSDRIFVKKGMLSTAEYETRLYRVTDVRITQGLIQRLCGTSTITLTTRDKDTPVIHIENVMQGEDVKELVSGLIEESRKKNRVITTDGGFF